MPEATCDLPSTYTGDGNRMPVTFAISKFQKARAEMAMLSPQPLASLGALGVLAAIGGASPSGLFVWLMRWLRDHLRFLFAAAALGCSSTSPSEPSEPSGPDGGLREVGREAGPWDGVYSCLGKPNQGDSCSEPLLYTRPWSLEVRDSTLQITAVAFDEPVITCTGQWEGTDFTCPIMYTRAGRVCNAPFHLRVEVDGTLTFWINTIESQQATCRR